MGPLLATLWLSSTASAMPWTVPTEELAESLGTDLGNLWPDAELDVLVVPSDGDRPLGDHLALEDGVVVLYRDGHRYEREWDGQTETAVLLARTWLRSLDIADGGWTPDAPENIDGVVLIETTPPPTERRRISLPHPEPTFGIGLRNSPANGLSIDGPRLNAGLRFSDVSLDGAVFIASGSYAAETSTDRRVGAFPELRNVRRQEYIDTWTTAVSAAWTPVHAPAEVAVAAGPLLTAGLELRGGVLRETWYEGDEDEAEFRAQLLTRERSLDIGPVVGAGVALAAGSNVRVHIVGVDRVRYRRLNPTAQRRWEHEIAVMGDLVLSL